MIIKDVDAIQYELASFGYSPRAILHIASPVSNFIINYSVIESPFGPCFLACIGNKICRLSFTFHLLQKRNKINLNKTNIKKAHSLFISELSQTWPQAIIKAISSSNQASEFTFIAQNLFDRKAKNNRFNLLSHGTTFHLEVWAALLSLKGGIVATYSQLAQFIARPKAFQAVGTAVSKNPIAYLIPCHRIIAKSGNPYSYRWGKDLKADILSWEGVDIK